MREQEVKAAIRTIDETEYCYRVLCPEDLDDLWKEAKEKTLIDGKPRIVRTWIVGDPDSSAYWGEDGHSSDPVFTK